MKRDRALELLSQHKPGLIADVFNPNIPLDTVQLSNYINKNTKQ